MCLFCLVVLHNRHFSDNWIFKRFKYIWFISRLNKLWTFYFLQAYQGGPVCLSLVLQQSCWFGDCLSFWELLMIDLSRGFGLSVCCIMSLPLSTPHDGSESLSLYIISAFIRYRYSYRSQCCDAHAVPVIDDDFMYPQYKAQYFSPMFTVGMLSKMAGAPGCYSEMQIGCCGVLRGAAGSSRLTCCCHPDVLLWLLRVSGVVIWQQEDLCEKSQSSRSAIKILSDPRCVSLLLPSSFTNTLGFSLHHSEALVLLALPLFFTSFTSPHFLILSPFYTFFFFFHPALFLIKLAGALIKCSSPSRPPPLGLGRALIPSPVLEALKSTARETASFFNLPFA